MFFYFRDYKGRTPLHIAARAGSTVAAETLLEFQPDIIDGTDSMDRTALIVAAQNGHAQVVNFLLSKKAKVTKDNNGENCLDHAVNNVWPDVALEIIDSNSPIWEKV